MKLTFDKRNLDVTEFVFSRDDTTATTVVETLKGEGVKIRFIDSSNGEASIVLSSITEVNDFIEGVRLTKERRGSMGFEADDVTLSIKRNTYGEPYELAVEFVFTVELSPTPYDFDYIYGEISMDDSEHFIDSIQRYFKKV
ncbi:hypothetical protein [Vibrio crassostreae]|uniref:hypothetical protein n=1 Tax=Vibrio crassostreae TaxID=246167 RepID=UPI001B310267|nr:hypothetical protein [Vibrio crassostreae]